MQCGQCGKQAIVQVGQALLCVDCHHKWQVTQTMIMQQHAIMMNLALEEMDAVTGFIGPSYRMRVPELPRPSVTANTVNVSNSTVGAINQGTVKDIIVHMKTLHDAGKVDAEHAFRALAKAIIEAQSLDATAKNEALEQVEYLSGQAAAEPAARKPGMIRAAMQALGAALGAAADLAALWEQVGSTIKGALGIE